MGPANGETGFPEEGAGAGAGGAVGLAEGSTGFSGAESSEPEECPTESAG